MTRIPVKQVQVDAQAILRAAEETQANAKQGPERLQASLESILDLRNDASPEVRSQRRTAILKEVDAHKGELSAKARTNLEALLTKLLPVDMDTMRIVMDRPKLSPELSLVAGALKMMYDPALGMPYRTRPSYVHYEGNKVASVIANPVPKERTPEEKRASYAVSIGKGGRIEQPDGKALTDGAVRLLLRDDGQWFAIRPDRYGPGEFTIGEDRAIGSIGVELKDGKIKSFNNELTPSSGAQYETYGVGLALMYLQLEAQGVAVGALAVRTLPMGSWDAHHQTVDDFLRFFASLHGGKPGQSPIENASAIEREVGKIAKLRADRIGSPVGKTAISKIADPGVDRTTTQGGLHIKEGIKAWAHVTGIKSSEPGRATVPTALGDLNVELGSGKLKIVDGEKMRAPTDAEANALAVVVSTAVAAADTDKALVLSILVALEKARGPVSTPPVLSSVAYPSLEVPSGLADARFLDHRHDLDVLKLLFREQGPLQDARSYAFGATAASSSTTGLGSLAPDGKSQSISFQAYGNEKADMETLCLLAKATGRTMHTTIRGNPVYAEPGDQYWKVRSRLDSLETSMGWHQVDSVADHRKSLAGYRGDHIPEGQVVKTARELGSHYGDYGIAGMARVGDDDNITELLIHLRDQMPPEALRDTVYYAVAQGQVKRGMEQAWVDLVKRVLVG